MNPLTIEDCVWAISCARDKIRELRRQIELIGEYAAPQARQQYARWIAELEAREARFAGAIKHLPLDVGKAGHA